MAAEPSPGPRQSASFVSSSDADWTLGESSSSELDSDDHRRGGGSVASVDGVRSDRAGARAGARAGSGDDDRDGAETTGSSNARSARGVTASARGWARWPAGAPADPPPRPVRPPRPRGDGGPPTSGVTGEVVTAVDATAPPPPVGAPDRDTAPAVACLVKSSVDLKMPGAMVCNGKSAK